jgi:outer membrane protein insertion porin family
MRGIFVYIALFASGSLAEELLSPATSPPLLVKSVAIHGTGVSVALRTQVGRQFDTGTIEKDVRQLWSTGRFEDIRVETKNEDEGTAVVFDVVETKPLELHELKIEPSTFGLQLTLPQGTPVTRLRAHQIASQAQKQLQDDGFRDAEVDYRIVPFVGKQVDLKLMVEPGERVRVKEVTFTGDTEFDSKELRGALRDMKIRRVVPPIPGVWNGWRLYPGYSPDAAASDVGRLRSLYLSKGYFDASVRLDDVKIDNNEARVRIAAEAGPKYQVRQLDIEGALTPDRDLCSRLFAAKRESERKGILDFAATVRIGPNQSESPSDPLVDLTASIERGRPYQVGRIDFTGNRHYSEAFLRRNLLLDEGNVFDERLLRKSMARLNETAVFEPISERNTIVHTDPETGIADINVRVTERKRGAWSLSGPVGPASFAGPLDATVNSRLPQWGAGLLELSTYTASISVYAFAGPLMPFLSIGSKLPVWLPILALHRPYSPGEGWKSGFSLAPQLGWQLMALSYGVGQIQHRLLPVLNGDRGLVPELPVTVETAKGDAVMFCEPPNPRFMFLRTPASLVLRLAGSFTGL